MNEIFLLDDVTVGYGGKPLLSDISLQIKKGTITALLGPNGAGKSTILKTLAGMLPVQKGRLLFMGKELGAYDRIHLAEQMAVLFPESLRATDLSVYETVAAGRFPFTGQFGELKPEDKKAIEEAIGFMDVAVLVERKIAELSDGQRQRVLLARAMAQQPKVLLLDEPTAFLDIRYKVEILSLLRKMATEGQITILMSLHEVGLGRKIADELLCVDAMHGWSFMPAKDMTKEQLCILFDMDGIHADERLTDLGIFTGE